MPLTRSTLLVVAALLAAWTLTWMAKVHVFDTAAPWLTTAAGSFAFWTIAKLVVWVVPALWLYRASGRRVSNELALHRPATWLPWGAGVGLAIALLAVVPRAVVGQPLLTVHLSYATLTALVIAPMFEEFLMRGAVLGNLARDQPFTIANVWTALLFLALHVPGWFFMGTLRQQVLAPVGGALSIVLLGVLFGYAVRRGGSVWAGVIAHAINNLASLA